MGAYCLRPLIRHHPAHVGEIIQVLWSDYYAAAFFGDGQEVACIPHAGCWLEIVGTGETSHRKVNLWSYPGTSFATRGRSSLGIDSSRRAADA